MGSVFKTNSKGFIKLFDSILEGTCFLNPLVFFFFLIPLPISVIFVLLFFLKNDVEDKLFFRHDEHMMGTVNLAFTSSLLLMPGDVLIVVTSSPK